MVLQLYIITSNINMYTKCTGLYLNNGTALNEIVKSHIASTTSVEFPDKQVIEPVRKAVPKVCQS